MRELDEWKSFIVTRNGVPVGELTPLHRHRFVAVETAVAIFRIAPRVDYRRFRADLDAAASQDVVPTDRRATPRPPPARHVGSHRPRSD
jgi:hypothetical protein